MSKRDLNTLKRDIEELPLAYQKEVLKVLKSRDIVVTENRNGSFVNLCGLEVEDLVALEDYLNYANKQRCCIQELETQRRNLEQKYFKNDVNKGSYELESNESCAQPQ